MVDIRQNQHLQPPAEHILAPFLSGFYQPPRIYDHILSSWIANKYVTERRLHCIE